MAVYRLGPTGERGRLMELIPGMTTFHQEAWYADTVRAGRPTWSAIYSWEDKPEIFSISFNTPIYSAGQLQGVIGVDMVLSQLSTWLAEIWRHQGGLALIVERLEVAPDVARAKWNTHAAIEDLPREQQVVHARQNLFDGTREKTPGMGWMFVPLTEYQGGGAAATIEPLAQHLPHYEWMLASNLAYGAQACYRGPRLYDTEATRDLVAKWVAWFRAHRAILESDVIHSSSRRADGRDLDWVLHANPALPERALLTVFNPTAEAVQRTMSLTLRSANLREHAQVVGPDALTDVMSQRWQLFAGLSWPLV